MLLNHLAGSRSVSVNLGSFELTRWVLPVYQFLATIDWIDQ
jgi:hypothetical protein